MLEQIMVSFGSFDEVVRKNVSEATRSDYIEKGVRLIDLYLNDRVISWGNKGVVRAKEIKKFKGSRRSRVFCSVFSTRFCA